MISALFCPACFWFFLSLSLTFCECDAILMKHGNQALHWFVCLLLCQLAWAMNGKDPFYSKTCAKFSARLKSGCAEKINKNPKRTDKKHSNYWSFYMFLLILCCFNKLNRVALNFRQSFMFVPDSWKLKPIVQFHWILFVAESFFQLLSIFIKSNFNIHEINTHGK